MSEEPVEPLPAQLAALFERERRTYVEDPRVKERVLHGVSAAVLFSLPSSGANAVKHGAELARWTASKVLAIAGAAFLAGGVSGMVAMKEWRAGHDGPSPPAPTVEAPATTSQPAPPVPKSAPDDSTVAVSDLPVAAPSSMSGPTHPTSPSASASSDRAGTLAREREVLDAARAALAHGRWDEALAAVHQHETHWPHGALEEEREVLAIRILAASGQTAAACKRASRFRRVFPTSMLSDVVTSALASAECAEGAGP
jgi:hypothetical protein